MPIKVLVAETAVLIVSLQVCALTRSWVGTSLSRRPTNGARDFLKPEDTAPAVDVLVDSGTAVRPRQVQQKINR